MDWIELDDYLVAKVTNQFPVCAGPHYSSPFYSPILKVAISTQFRPSWTTPPPTFHLQYFFIFVSLSASFFLLHLSLSLPSLFLRVSWLPCWVSTHYKILSLTLFLSLFLSLSLALTLFTLTISYFCFSCTNDLHNILILMCTRPLSFSCILGI